MREVVDTLRIISDSLAGIKQVINKLKEEGYEHTGPIIETTKINDGDPEFQAGMTKYK